MNLLFVCTHNRCRSILSEAITRQCADGRIGVASAGSHPAETPHPLSLKYLEEAGYDITGLSSKSWENLEGFMPDIIITVCDSAAGETCPLWLGETPRVHWGLPDPSKLEGTEEEIANAFKNLISNIENRIHRLLELPLESMAANELRNFMQTLVEQH